MELDFFFKAGISDGSLRITIQNRREFSKARFSGRADYLDNEIGGAASR